ncbi:MAG: tRNA dihydrouridine synthase DusB [Oceanococcaceae bacterium]
MPAIHGIATPVILAPMAGVTDAPMRHLCRQFGADLCYGEMTAADADDAQRSKFQRRKHAQDEPRPWIVQLAGAEPEILAQGARDHVAAGADVIDINMGCPAKKVRKKACGSALMADPGRVAAIFAAVREAVSVPVTVKMRTGPHRGWRNAVALAELAEDAGLAAIAVHGRTRADMYRGEAEYQTIRDVCGAVSIPVIANGDITSAESALRVLEHTRADGVMVGRAALGQPWIFGQIRAALDGRPIPPMPRAAAMLPWVNAHADAVDAHYGEQLGLRVFRKHLAAWLESLHMPRGERLAILQAPSRDSGLHLLAQAVGSH